MNTRLGWAIILPFVACTVQWLLWETIRPYVWFLFFPAAFFSAWIGGLRGGLAATVISALLVWFFFIPPVFSFELEHASAGFSIVVFVVMGGLFAFFFERLQQAMSRTDDALAEAKIANEKINLLYQKTLELDVLKSQFFANVSHELRTPLTLILAPLEQRLRHADLSPAERHETEIMLRNARLLYRHVSDLLDAAKLEAGRMSLVWSRIDLAHLVRAMVSHFETLARERHIDYRVTAPATLLAEADSEKVQRVLLNLLSNSFKFTPDGGVISVSLIEQGAKAVIEVQDSGPGVPISLREAVFERFRQGEDKAQQRHTGTGLGLAIVKEFVELHHGAVTLGEAAEGGALFSVQLPLTAPLGSELGEPSQLDAVIDFQAVEELKTHTTPILPMVGQAAGDASPLILIVEDNADLNEFIATTLRPNYRVASACNGREGGQMALALHPDLILADVMMPVMTGDEMVLELRREPGMVNIPIVMITAKADDELRMRMLKAGVQDYLNKPFATDELLARVDGLVSTRRRTVEQLGQSAAAARQSEQRFRATFEQAAVGVALMAPDGHWLQVNQKLCQIVGYSQQELLTLTFQEITHPDDLPLGLSQMQRMLAGEIQTYALEKRYRRQGGGWIWVNLTFALVRTPDGAPDYFITVVEDIQRRKVAEAAIERSAQRLRYLAEIVEKIAGVRDLTSLMDIVRHALRDLTGADGAALVMRKDERCHYVDEDAIGPLWKGQSFPIEACISGWAMLHAQTVVIEDIYADARIPHEAYRPTFVKSLSMVPIGRQHPLGAIGCYWASQHLATTEELELQQAVADAMSVALENLDLMRALTTAKQIAELAAADARSQTAALQEAQRVANIGSWQWDVQSDFHIWSEEIYRIYGRDPTLPPAVYPEVQQYFTPESWVRLAAAVEQILLTGLSYECDAEVVQPDGEHRWIIARGAAIRADDGTIRKLHGTVQDITARKQAELALSKVQAEALKEQRQARLAALNLMEDAITARDFAQSTQRALQASESNYRLLAENSDDAIFWRGVDGSYQYFSPASERILGHTAAECLADAELMVRIVHADDRAAFCEHLQDKHNPDEGDLEFRVLHPDGSIRWIAHHCQVLYGADGEFMGRTGTNHDITARKLAEVRRDLFSEALRQSAMPLLLVNPQGNITYLNAAFTNLFGYQLDELEGKSVSCLLPQAEVELRGQQEIMAQVQAHGSWSGEVERLAKDGTLIPTTSVVGAIVDHQGNLQGYVGSYLDLRSLKEKELMLRKLSLAVEQSPESIVISDLEANIEYVNDTFVRNTGYSREEVIGQNPRVLHSGKTPKATYDALWKSLTAGLTWQGEFINHRKDGSEYIERAIISPVRQPDGRTTHYLAIKEDITDKKRAEAEIHRLAFYDTLTGLPNRALLLEHLTQTLATSRRSGHVSALMSFNIDRFKNINDAGGQALGDALLKAIGDRLQQILREGDGVARMAGDEFCILLTDLGPNLEDAAHFALHVSEKIHASLLRAFDLEVEHFTLSACLGIALFPESKADAPLDILRRANTALHHAKTRGSGQTAFFEGGLDQIAKQRFDIERELHQAIVDKQLRVYLQPQVDADSNIVGAEALVRWQHPQRGLVPPNVFIPIAEESNLIIEIGAWVFAEVCQYLARPEVAALPIRIAVNISPRHFRQPNFVDQIKRGLATSGAEPMRLTLEITEGMVIDNLNDVIAKMTELSAMGIHFSMDDFGTGYSSLSYLKRLPIHELKIDKSFVQDVTTDANDAALVETILSVAKYMHLKVVAEGVETLEQAAFLNQRGSVIHQGYLFGKPEPAEEWLAKLSA